MQKRGVAGVEERTTKTKIDLSTTTSTSDLTTRSLTSTEWNDILISGSHADQITTNNPQTTQSQTTTEWSGIMDNRPQDQMTTSNPHVTSSPSTLLSSRALSRVSIATVLVVLQFGVGLVIERSLVRFPAGALSSQLDQLSHPYGV